VAAAGYRIYTNLFMGKHLYVDDLVTLESARYNLVGWNISQGTLAKVEAQVRRVTDSEVALIAEALGVEITELYKGS